MDRAGRRYLATVGIGYAVLLPAAAAMHSILSVDPMRVAGGATAVVLIPWVVVIQTWPPIRYAFGEESFFRLALLAACAHLAGALGFTLLLLAGGGIGGGLAETAPWAVLYAFGSAAWAVLAALVVDARLRSRGSRAW